jgi:hypothetical protein
MKKASLLLGMVIACLCSTSPVSAQASLGSSTQYVGNGGGQRYFEWFDTEGTRIKTAEEMGVKGTPMLHEGWGNGNVVYTNGQKLKIEKMNFSLCENKLYYTLDKRLFQIVLPVASFDITIPDNEGDDYTYRFKSGFPAIDNQDELSLYEVLYEGDNIQLLQWNRKKMKEIFNYGNSREKEFVLEQQLYVYQPKEKTITALKQAIPAIRKTLPGYSDIIHAYAEKHKLNPHNKNEVTDLIAYLDKQH